MSTASKHDARAREDPKLLSLVVPAYNEEGNLIPLYEELCTHLDGQSWELVIVDDGSRDRTWQVIEELTQKDPRVRGLSLSRNFGHQYALLAGLKDARGDAVVSLDADLQHPPAMIPELVERWKCGINVVHTQRRAEGELGWFKRETSRWFYRLISRLSGLSIHEGQSDFRLLDRRVVTAVTGMVEADLFLRGLVHWVGYRSETVPYRVRKRSWGRSKYSLGRMLYLALAGVTSVSTLPLRLGIIAGFVTSGLAFLEILYVVFVSWKGDPVPGWASLAGLVALLFGMNFILLGFLGIYVGHIFGRVQNHPPFLIERRAPESYPIERDPALR
jgi:dolichol-phosphate mannosyltransferase